MNKPCGYVCKSEADRHKTIYELLTPDLQKLVKDAKRGERLHTVGRLDLETSGLLLITTDGFFSNRLTNPQNSITKTYKAHLSTPVPSQTQAHYILKAKQGLLMPAEKKSPEEMSAPSIIQFITDQDCTITVTEGKFHEVRRIFRALGNEVTELQRLSIGSLQLDDTLKEGQYRPLTAQELSRLM